MCDIFIFFLDSQCVKANKLFPTGWFIAVATLKRVAVEITFGQMTKQILQKVLYFRMVEQVDKLEKYALNVIKY